MGFDLVFLVVDLYLWLLCDTLSGVSVYKLVDDYLLSSVLRFVW